MLYEFIQKVLNAYTHYINNTPDSQYDLKVKYVCLRKPHKYNIIIHFLIKEWNQLTVNKLLEMFLIKYYLTSLILFEMFNDELFILQHFVYTLALALLMTKLHYYTKLYDFVLF